MGGDPGGSAAAPAEVGQTLRALQPVVVQRRRVLDRQDDRLAPAALRRRLQMRLENVVHRNLRVGKQPVRGLALRLAREHLRQRPSGLLLPRPAHPGNAVPDPRVGMRAAGVLPRRPARAFGKRRLRSPSDRPGRRPAELLAPVRGQRADPDPPLRTPPPRGLPGMRPSGRPVAGSRVPGPDESEGGQGTDPVRRLPVRRKPRRREAQDPRGQIAHPDARKDQETVVLRDPTDVRRPRRRAPADEIVARLRMPSGRPEADPAQAAVPLRDDPVPQPRPRRQGRPLRMQLRHHRPPGPDVRSIGRHLQPDLPEILERRLDPGIRNRSRRTGMRRGGSRPRLRKLDPQIRRQSRKRAPRGAEAEIPLRVAPIRGLAKPARQRVARAALLGDRLPKPRPYVGAEPPLNLFHDRH